MVMSMRRLVQFPFNLLTVLVSVGLAIILFIFAQPDSAEDLLQDKGSIRIGYAIEYPYAYVDAHQRVRGESADSAREMARQLGFKQIEWIEMPFSQLIPQLQSRQIDVIAAGMFITRDRQQLVRFSIPTLQVYPGLLLPASNPKFIQPADLENQRSDITLAVIDKSVEQITLQQHGGAQIKTVSNAIHALDALDSGEADGILLSLPSLRVFTDNYPDDYMLFTLGKTHTPSFAADYVAFAFHRDDTALVTAWNEQLQNWVGSESHLQLIASYGFKPMDVPRMTSR